MNRHSTYAMSKEIAEDLVHSYGSEFPVVVIRPAIIAAAYSEPEEGFVQGFQVKFEIIFLVFTLILRLKGLNGVLAFLMSGLSRVLRQKGEIEYKLIPVDFTVNTTIVAAASQGASKSKCPTFFNSVASPNNPLPLHVFRKILNETFHESPPLKNIFSYPHYHIVSNFFVFSLLWFFLQFLPAMAIDAVRAVQGKKTL
jgi:alcohol-forming fatty acyl-CoA reductase